MLLGHFVRSFLTFTGYQEVIKNALVLFFHFHFHKTGTWKNTIFRENSYFNILFFLSQYGVGPTAVDIMQRTLTKTKKVARRRSEIGYRQFYTVEQLRRLRGNRD